MPAPLITIGITAYNAQDTIARAVESALAQDWPNAEILVYDDASSDNTCEILKNFADIRVIAGNENRGVAFARNQLIENARGEFLAFFDDDDESLPARLKTQYERIIRYEHDVAQGAPVVCYTARTQIYPGDAERYETAPGSDIYIPAPHGEAMAQRILLGTPLRNGFGSMPTCSQMARISTYRLLGGFDTDFTRSEDTDFNVRLALAGGHFIGIAEPLVRQSMTLASEKTLRAEEQMMLQLLAKHHSFIEDYAPYPFCRRWIETKYDYLRGDRKSFARKLMVLALTQPLCTLKRLLWALPNRAFHKVEHRFHAGEAS